MKKSEIKALLKTIETFCNEEGHRFTESRRLVAEIIASSQKPAGAYDVLAQLGKHLDNPKPPTAYRAIEFLLEHDFIHRIESLNAYVPCQANHRHNGSQFMICDQCGDVTEAHLCHLPHSLADKAQDDGFKTSSWNVEIHGVCKACLR